LEIIQGFEGMKGCHFCLLGPGRSSTATDDDATDTTRRGAGGADLGIQARLRTLTSSLWGKRGSASSEGSAGRSGGGGGGGVVDFERIDTTDSATMFALHLLQRGLPHVSICSGGYVVRAFFIRFIRRGWRGCTSNCTV
jgi:hypothetical protein